MLLETFVHSHPTKNVLPSSGQKENADFCPLVETLICVHCCEGSTNVHARYLCLYFFLLFESHFIANFLVTIFSFAIIAERKIKPSSHLKCLKLGRVNRRVTRWIARTCKFCVLKGVPLGIRQRCLSTPLSTHGVTHLKNRTSNVSKQHLTDQPPSANSPLHKQSPFLFFHLL